METHANTILVIRVTEVGKVYLISFFSHCTTCTFNKALTHVLECLIVSHMHSGDNT